MRKNDNRKKGFTIIEITLVIAIAGLIFLMVFVALPSMQRMARDTQRKEDVAKLKESIKKYQSNNRGVLPTNSSQQSSFKTKYLNEFRDPDGTSYSLAWGTGAYTYSGAKMDHKMYIRIGGRCEGETIVATDNPRRIAILYRLEGSGIYCDDM